MIEFSRAQLTHFVVHHVGNKGLGEEIILSQQTTEFADDFVKETALRYFLSPFKNDVYYQFKGKIDISLDSVANFCEDIFKDNKFFVKFSQGIAKHLYNQSLHPKIAAGPLYVCYFKDVIVDGELLDAIGIFKSEKKSTYIQVNVKSGENILNEINIDTESGIDVKKLDKGCLVFGTEKETGYKLSIIDNNNKVAECALYWQEDFLNAKIKQNKFFHTKNFYDASLAFLEESEEIQSGLTKLAKVNLKNKVMNYLVEREIFNQAEFEKEVLVTKTLTDAFNEFQIDFHKRYDLPKPVKEFEVSATAVAKYKKHTCEVVKLDKNFHIYIHSSVDRIEKGFDEDKNLKFYKLYYTNEE